VVSIEVASYVLLSYAKNLPDTLDQAMPVFRGITKHLSDSGGFRSTQDTVIGIQALAKFASFLSVDDMSVVVSMLLDGDEKFESEVINNDNSDLVQIANVNLSDTFTYGTAQLKSVGQGSVFTQLVQHYNVRDSSQDPFELSFERINIVKRDTDSQTSNNMCVQIKTKASDVPENRVDDGMSLLMVEHPSGYGYESHNVVSGIPAKVEPSAEKTTFYYDNLAEEKVITVCMIKNEDVANPKPINIIVQDYYNPEASSSVEMELTSEQNADVCDLCNGACGDICPTLPSGDNSGVSSGTAERPAKSANWNLKKATKWMAPPPVLEFMEEHQLDEKLFKRYVKSRVKAMQREGRPTKLIEMLSKGKGGWNKDQYEKYLQNPLNPYNSDTLLEDLMKHLEMQVGLLKNILRMKN